MNPFILFTIVYPDKLSDNRGAIVKILRFFSLIFFSQLVIVSALAQTNLSAFMTPPDILNNESASNISLQNNRGSAATVYGLYVRQYAYVTPGNPGRRAAVGSNYLYNMLYEAIYYENIIIPSSPPGCALPGCTWGSDTTKYNWCIYLGALAPVSTSSGYTANVPPSTEAASSTCFYNYNLISNYVYLGPISCDDRTLACTVANQQTQSFS
jgi:hypothetical protein